MVRGPIKALIPSPLRRVARNLYTAVKSQSLEWVFADVYRRNGWGGDTGCYSGPGSHLAGIVEPYLESVTVFLERLSQKPVVVDLGCGDFNVSQHLVPFTNLFIGCDIARVVVERNRQLFPTVTFHQVDITRGPLPDADICIVRQVLQHLDNRSIVAALHKMARYPIWVVTEHVPFGDNFTPNIDIRAGCDVRVPLGSGVVLNAPPFNFHDYTSSLLCEVEFRYPPCNGRIDGRIRSEVFTKTPPDSRVLTLLPRSPRVLARKECARPADGVDLMRVPGET
jgi:SAM-dependent methyltransferase